MYKKYWLPQDLEQIKKEIQLGSIIKSNITYSGTSTIYSQGRDPITGWVRQIDLLRNGSYRTLRNPTGFAICLEQPAGRGTIWIYLHRVRQYKNPKQFAWLEIEQDEKYDIKGKKKVSVFNYGEHSFKVAFGDTR